MLSFRSCWAVECFRLPVVGLLLGSCWAVECFWQCNFAILLEMEESGETEYEWDRPELRQVCPQKTKKGEFGQVTK